MVIVILGITVLLAKLFPFGGQLTGMLLGGMYGPIFGKGSPATFHLVVLLANYIPAAVVAAIFVRVSHLRSRLPKEIPGKIAILIGLVLLVIYLIPRLFASTVQGGGPAFVASMFGPFFIIPADILVVVGVVRVLLAALPRLTDGGKQFSVNKSDDADLGALPPVSALLGTCPNCGKIISLSAKECSHCKALFGPNSTWKVLR